MNPSAKGWIPKALQTLTNQRGLYTTNEALYSALSDSGFIYGHSVKSILNFNPAYPFTTNENHKLNLFCALFYSYNSHKADDFITTSLAFYKELTLKKRSLIEDLIGTKKDVNALEDIIGTRVLSLTNPLSKNFGILGNNSYLYLDIIAFAEFLKTGTIDKIKLKELESYLFNLVDKFNPIKKTTYTKLLSKSFEQSLRYNTLDALTEVSVIPSTAYNYYILDIVCMCIWQAKFSTPVHSVELDDELNHLAVSNEDLQRSYSKLSDFYKNYKNELYVFNSKTVIQNIYGNSNELVLKLLSRNRKRLVNEINESKHLVKLLATAQTRALTKEEQHTVNKQLLDIFKSIPSLAIFLLPGGSLLLPIVVKFIPNILPSSFNENKLDPN